MFKFKERPYNLLLLTAILLFIVALFSFNVPVDIHFPDTYYIVPLALLIWLPTIILVLFWLLYLLTKRFLFFKILTWIHIILTIIFSILILILPFVFTTSFTVIGTPRPYYDFNGLHRGNITEMIPLILLILLLGQATYFVNLLVGIIKKVGRQNSH